MSYRTKYTLEDFRNMRDALDRLLFDDAKQPNICGLYNLENLGEREGTLELGEFIHSSIACNLASIVQSIDRILQLPRSQIACEQLTEVLILRCDVLRETIRAASKDTFKSETANETNVRLWSGFLKHPDRFVFAHKCFGNLEIDFYKFVIDDGVLKDWADKGKNSRPKKKRFKLAAEEKARFANKLVRVSYPSPASLIDFFKDTRDRIKHVISAQG